jgi:SAM-dependent methyltransferase
MRTVNSLVPGWQAGGARLAVLIVIIQALGLRAGWSQEPVQPRINEEEFLKQEKIYHSQGTDGRRVYTTDRGLSRYAELLPSGFCDALRKLGSSDRWLDIGAGEGQAILDYYAPEGAGAQAEKCRGSGPRARAVAISIEDRRTENWKQQAARLGEDRIRYLSGKRLSQYSSEELGKFQIITDVYGGFTYTEDLSRFVDKMLRLLEVGGSFYTLATGVHLEDGKDRLGTLYLTELEDAFGREVKMCSWLKKISCVQVTCESKSDLKRPTELITIRKLCSDTSVPRTKLVEFEAGYPPGRCFQLDQ